MSRRAPTHARGHGGEHVLIGGVPLHGRLVQFLGEQLPEASRLTISNLTRVGGGNARWAFAFEASWIVRGNRTARDCILLLKAESAQLDMDLASEIQVLRALETSAVPTPAVLWADPQGAWLGGPSMILQRMSGVSDIKALMAAGPGNCGARVGRQLAQIAAQLHALDWREYDLSSIAPSTRDGAAVTQVLRWEEVFRQNRMEPLPALEFAFQWLKRHAPPAQRISLVHGDFRFGNCLYDQGGITAMLDWEMVHLGDPVEDIAWAYRSLWSPQQHVPLDDFIALYSSLSGIAVPAGTLHFYRMFSEVKHAVISISAARAFAEGRSSSVRNADRMTMVPGLLRQFFDWAQAER